jgi:hypothetical protein
MHRRLSADENWAESDAEKTAVEAIRRLASFVKSKSSTTKEKTPALRGMSHPPTISTHRAVEVIALATNDTDCVPAMKHARRSRIQIALIIVPGYSHAPELLTHCDFTRRISWPA